MSTQPESRLQRKIRETLETTFPGSFWFKYHGGPFTKAGVPDLLGVVQGRMCAIEVKRPGEEASSIQRATIARLRGAGAVSAVVETPREAVMLVRDALGMLCRYHESSAAGVMRRCRLKLNHPGDHKLVVP